MKTLKILAISMLIFTGTAMAEENHHGAMNHDQHQMEMMDHGQYEHMAEAKSVRQVEASKVCMVNDTVFDRDQIAVDYPGVVDQYGDGTEPLSGLLHGVGPAFR